MVALVSLIAVLTLTACSGGSSNGTSSRGSEATGNAAGNTMENTGIPTPAQSEEEPFKISIMVPAFSTELPDDDSPVIQRLEEYTNTDVEIQFVPNSSYPDKMNTTFVSGNMPMVMVVDKSPSFINAARSGAFWEVGLDGWALVPRLVGPAVLGVILLLFIPVIKRRSARPA